MLFSIVGTDVENSLELRKRARPAHLERLHSLREAGRLVLAGPNPAIESNEPGEAGFSGSIVIAEFPTLAAAQAWAQGDPYVAAGVYREVVVKPFKKVLP
jgi:uncharacterized protein